MANRDARHIAVIIPYFSGPQFIHECLSSLDQSTVECHIYVVDNDPVGVPEVTSVRPLTIIKTKPAIGYGRAANVGVHQAIIDGAEVIIVTNQDVTFLPDTLQKLTQGIPEESKLVINTPIILDYDLKRISPFFISQVIVSTDYMQDLEQSRVKEYYNAKGAYGACFAFPARLFNTVGLFDPVFQMYGEDEDLFERVQRVDGEVRLVPDARIGHFHNHVNASGKVKTRIQYWAQKAHRIFDIRYKKITLTGQLARTFKDSLKYILRGEFKYGILLPIHHAKYLFATKSIRNISTPAIKMRIDAQIGRDLDDGKN